MTLTQLDPLQLPPLLVFLDTVCPGVPFLDENVHFDLQDPIDAKSIAAINNLPWPLADTPASRVHTRAQLDKSYLHVARPPFEHDVRRNIEPTTYVPLPLHVARAFAQTCSAHPAARDNGGLHIAASVNPLMQDPFPVINNGCVSVMVEMRSSRRHAAAADARSPFNKVTTSLNKLLRMGGPDPRESYFAPVVGGTENTAPRRGKSRLPFARVLVYDSATYAAHVRGASRVLVSCNVGVVNVFGMTDDCDYAATEDGMSTTAVFPLGARGSVNGPGVSGTDSGSNGASGAADGVTSNGASNGTAGETANGAASGNSSETPNGNNTTATAANSALGEGAGVAESNAASGRGSSSGAATTAVRPYHKVTERPDLRIQLRSHVFVTCAHALPSESAVVLGLSSGELVMINLADLTFRLFDDVAAPPDAPSPHTHAVTALSAFRHAAHGLLLVAGYANGEVTIVDPAGAPAAQPYRKTVEVSDTLATYFRKFDLSPLHEADNPECLVGHFKISHKAVTAVASTLSPESAHANSPHVLALACDDGLVRFVDLISTHGRNYGDAANFYSQPVVSDIVLNYFQDGVRSVAFSPDARFFCVAGKGDLIEVFRMAYYNINGLLHKNADALRGRSRSGTVNSAGSAFLLPSASTHTASLDLPRDDHDHHAHSLAYAGGTYMAPGYSTSGYLGYSTAHSTHSTGHSGGHSGHGTHYPPALKDIAVVTRLKGHTNTVEHVAFLRSDDAAVETLRTYKLVSCGSDGRVILWDFDSKALPRVKKSHITTRRPSVRRAGGGVGPGAAVHGAHGSITSGLGSGAATSGAIPGVSVTASLLGMTGVPSSPKSHIRNRSLSHQTEDMTITSSFSALGISRLLSNSPQPLANLDNAEEHLKIVLLLYRSLFEVRMKKHYARARDGKRRYNCLVHAVVDDKTLPLIEIPLLSIDMSCLVRDGKLQGVHVNPLSFWVFGRSGDIFRYSLVQGH